MLGGGQCEAVLGEDCLAMGQTMIIDEVDIRKYRPKGMVDVNLVLPAEILYFIFDHLAPKEMKLVVQV